VTCFVNGSFAFTTRTGFYASVDYGVDHQNAATIFQAGATLTGLANVATGATLDNTPASNSLFLRVSARDSLGNTALLFPTADNTIVSDDEDDALKFGIDKVAPFVLNATTPTNNGANDRPLNFLIEAADTSTPPAGPSGINVGSGASGAVIVRVERITPSGTVCLDADASPAQTFNCNTGGNQGNGTEAVAHNTTFNFGNPATQGYYRVTYSVRDNAGNVSATSVVTSLVDTGNPTAGAVVTPSTITGNASAAFSSDVSDNLDLGDVVAYIGYGPAAASVAFIQDVAAPTGIGTYGPDTFTTGPTSATTTVPNFIRSIQAGITGAISRATTVTFNVRDVAGVVDNDPCAAPDDVDDPALNPTQNCIARRDNISNAVNAGIPGSGANAQTSFDDVQGLAAFTTNAPSETTVCNGTGTGANQPCPTNPTSTTLTVSASGPSTGSEPFNTHPFARVNLYYSGPATGGKLVLIGAAAQTATQETGGVRTFNWSLTWTPGSLTPGAYTVVAIGVDSKGQGLVGNNQTVTIVVD
jgi:hypothetical protein